MIILSVNHDHDSSVCVLEDGKVVYYMKEERLSQIKREPIPLYALEEVARRFEGRIDVALIHRIWNDYALDYKMGIYKTVYNYILKFIKPKKIINYSVSNHHDCHATHAFLNSGFEESLVFTIDGGGSAFFYDTKRRAYEVESAYYYNNKNQKALLSKNFVRMFVNDDPEEIEKEINEYYNNQVNVKVLKTLSATTYYTTAAGLINEGVLECGKPMGLSSYGTNTPEEYFKDIIDLIDNQNPNNFHFDLNEDDVIKNLPCYLERTFKVTKENFQHYSNYCKLVQKITENYVLNFIKDHVEKTGIKNVCLSGGYANNIVTNAFLKKMLPDVEFYFEPVCDDSGISIGAAYEYYCDLSSEHRITPAKDNFYISYEKEELTDKRLVTLEMHELLEYFLKAKTIAVFQKNPEAGQRALGNRSIIFDARIKDGKDIVNKIKKREWYRPFAGVIRKEDFKDHFNTFGFQDSPYMMINFDAKDHTKQMYPAIIHVDGTCRVQTVTEGFFYDFISLLKEKSGSSLILNTSLNLAGKPLVHSVADAIETFDNSDLDILYFVEEKKALIKPI